ASAWSTAPGTAAASVSAASRLSGEYRTVVVAVAGALVGSTVVKPAVCRSPDTLRPSPLTPTPFSTRTWTSCGATVSTFGFGDPAGFAAFGARGLSLMTESYSARPATSSSSTRLPPWPGGGAGKPGGVYAGFAIGAVRKLTRFGSSPCSWDASSLRSPNEVSRSSVSDFVAADRNFVSATGLTSSLVLLAARTIEPRNRCWRWMRPRSDPSPIPYRARTYASACSPLSTDVPAGSRSPLSSSRSGVVLQIDTPLSASTIVLKPVKSTCT